jgi:UDP-glucose:(heptosyl)LPS alpha-1,3-glucosyltransferase
MLQLHKNSGSARTAFDSIHYFKARGYEVHVASLTMNKQQLLKLGVIPHKLFPWIKSTGLFRRRWYDLQVQRLRKKLQPSVTVGHGDLRDQDVLNIHNSVFLASELIHGKPLEPMHEMALTHGPILKDQKFKKLIVYTNLQKHDTVKRFGVPAENIKVIYPALDTTTFYPTPEKRNELRARFGFPDKVVVSLVTSGNFIKRGLDLYCEAIDSLPEEILSMASFRVLGKEEPGIKKSKHITFDPGLPDIQNYYNAIDIFVLPARIEEFGRVVLEAMGCGLPVITTDKVGASELLSGDSSEFVVPSHNVEKLKEAMAKLVASNELRARLGKLNIDLALAETEDKLYANYDEVFNPFIVKL